MASEVYGGGPNRGLAMQKVNAPAIALIVMAGIGILGQLISLVLRMLGTGMSMMSMPGSGSDGSEQLAAMMSGTLGVVAGILGILVGGFIIFAAMKMRALQSWPLALAASVVAMLPCLSPCCCLGLPIGIWSLVVLLDNNVKASFV
jgi:hypothetical protein